MKKSLLVTSLLLSSTLLSSHFANAETSVSVTPDTLKNNGVEVTKASQLAEKINSGQETQAEQFLESNSITTSQTNPNFKKEFSDGSFIEQKVEDATPTKSFSKDGLNRVVADTGGIGQADRIIHVTTGGTWGSMGYYVRIYKPLQGTKYIRSIYGQHYGGTVQSVQLSIIRKNASTVEPAYANGLGHSAFGPLTRSINLQFFLKNNGGYYSVTKDIN